MGAKMVVRSLVDLQALEKIELEGYSIETSAKLSFLFALFHSETETEQQQRETFESLRKSHSESYLGSHPPSDGKWETWAKTAGDAPYPVGIKLAPITSLFTHKFFPDIPLSDLYIKLKLLTDAYKAYCRDIPGCRIPPPDPMPASMKKAASAFNDSVTVSCQPKYRVMLCKTGPLNVSNRTPEDHDTRSEAYHVNSTACFCTKPTNTAEAECIAWCTRIHLHPTRSGIASCQERYTMLLMVMLVMKVIFY